MPELNFHKNEVVNITLAKYYETFSMTLDTQDFVPAKYNEKIVNYIYKNLKRAFRRADRCDRLYQRALREEAAIEKELEELNDSLTQELEELRPAPDTAGCDRDDSYTAAGGENVSSAKRGVENVGPPGQDRSD